MCRDQPAAARRCACCYYIHVALHFDFFLVSTAPKEKPQDVSKMSKNKKKKMKQKQKKKDALIQIQLQQLEEIDREKRKSVCVFEI